jgi:Flp pilus assembly protein TadG
MHRSPIDRSPRHHRRDRPAWLRAWRWARPRDAEHLSIGQSLVELALLFPVLLMLLLGALDLGRVYYAQIAVTNAAREGAMVAANTPTSYQAGAPCDATTNAVTCAAIREGQNGLVDIDPADVSLACTPSCTSVFGNRVAVTVAGHFDLFTPFVGLLVGGQQISFQQTATADVVITPDAAGAPTPSPSPSPSPSPTASPTPGPTPSGGPTPSPSPSSSPSPSPTPQCAPPVVSFTYSQQNKNQPVNFTSTSSPTTGVCAISYWQWNFGDGHSSAGAVGTTSHDYPSHHPDGSSFNVTLTVTSPTGVYSVVAQITTKS